MISLDFDQSAQKVAEKGFLFAKTMNAEVTLLHVLTDSQHYLLTNHVAIMDFAGHLDTSKKFTKETEVYYDISKIESMARD